MSFLLGWWLVHRALPMLEGAAALPGLKQAVTVDRDSWGVPHIRASSVEDLVEAQGYVVAQDRLWQMDILRRIAAGELSEIFGPGTVQLDRQYRTLSLHVAAEREARNLDPETRMMLEAYARGVNHFIEERRNSLPWEFLFLRYKPRPWKPSDSLLIAGYMYQTLTNTWERELTRSKVTQIVGADRAKELYLVDSPADHIVVGGAEPPAKASPTKRPIPARQPQPDDREPAPQLWKSVPAMLVQFDEEIRAGIGSNNWVVDGTHTASGKPLLANDTHLQLSVPCIWYMVHLTAPGWNVKGFTLPGAPLVVIGHNDRIAWGFTNNGADVEDLYIETFHPDHAREYLVNGKYVPAEVRTERIHVKGEEDVLFDVFVTRHGPVLRREAGRSYALKWTALEPGGLTPSYALVGRAQNWKEFLGAIRQVPGPAQNAVYADVDGNIGFIVAAKIPIRKNGDGTVPVPGDTDDYEWTGYIPFDELPQVLNPPGGVIATANARVVGPAYKHYLTDRWASPYRTARIYELLEAKINLRPEDMLAIQTDIVSLPHRFLAGELVRASQSVKPKDGRAQQMVTRLADWDGRATPDSAETAFLEFVRLRLMHHILQPYLAEATNAYEWRDAVFLEKVLRERPVYWLPPSFRTYDEFLAACADQAAAILTRETKSNDISGWRWGHLNALQMTHPLGRSGWLHRLLSIGPTDQAGSTYAVKAMQPSHGPAMRFVADLSNWDASLMQITLGQSGQYGSAHYRDQFPYWFEGRAIQAPFSDAAEGRARAHTLRLEPAAAP